MREDAAARQAGLLAAALLVLAGCDAASDEPDTAEAPVVQSTASQGAAPIPQDPGATPMEERIARLGLLNKRNNLSEEIEMKPGEAREIGPVTIRLAACERTAPWELPQEVGAFVQVDIRERADAAPTRVFSGWLFRESPSLNVVEHPVYDVWVKDCTMAFPGDEGRPASKPSPAPRRPAEAAPAPAAPAR